MAPRQRIAEVAPASSAEEELSSVGVGKLPLSPPLDEERARDQHDRFNIGALVRASIASLSLHIYIYLYLYIYIYIKRATHSLSSIE